MQTQARSNKNVPADAGQDIEVWQTRLSDWQLFFTLV